MKHLLLSTLICLAVQANAQLTTYRTYYDELTRTRLHEEWTAKLSPNRARGVKHGLYKEFDADGNLIREMQYADGTQDGYARMYYFVPDPQQRPCYGKLIGDFNFKNGERHGTQKDYRCNQGNMTVAKQSEYNEGQLLSETSYHHNGVKAYEKRYNGLNKEWNKAGKLIAEYNLVDGVESGSKVLYHDNGQVKLKGQMLNGDYTGNWTAYNEDGTLLSQFTKDPNVYYFTQLEKYSQEGVLTETATHKDGIHFITRYDSITTNKILEEYRKYSSETKFTIVNERSYFYAANGNIKTKFQYASNGYYTSIQVFDEAGKQIGGGDFAEEGFPDGDWTVYRNADGQFNWDPEVSDRYYKTTFVDGEPGEFTGFAIDGSKVGKGAFIPLQGFQFQETGQWEYYYPSGQIRLEGEFERGKKNGDWKAYNEDGSLKAVQQYSYGKLMKEQSAEEISAKAFADKKRILINRYSNYATQNSNPIVQYYQYQARSTDRYIIFEKGLVLINHHFSRLQTCSDINCLQTIQQDLELVERALKKYQNQSPGSLIVKLPLAKKPEKIEQLLLN